MENKKTIRFEAERVPITEIAVGEFFSHYPPAYWVFKDLDSSKAEKVYIRTNTPLDAGDEPDYQVTRVRIIHLP